MPVFTVVIVTSLAPPIVMTAGVTYRVAHALHVNLGGVE